MKMLGPRVSTQGARVAVVASGSWRPVGATSGDRGYTYAWQKARERYLLDNPICVMCAAADPDIAVPATVVDHRIPHRGDQTLFWDRTNWQSLCATHHSGDKQREENGLGSQVP